MITQKQTATKIFLFCLRLIVGVTFIYASISKIAHPQAFADSIYNYQLFPPLIIKPLSLFLPFFEMICGLFLICGIFKRSTAILLCGLLGLFTIAIFINLVRGLNINCGCFSQFSDKNNLLISIVENLFLIFITAILITKESKKSF